MDTRKARQILSLRALEAADEAELLLGLIAGRDVAWHLDYVLLGATAFRPRPADFEDPAMLEAFGEEGLRLWLDLQAKALWRARESSLDLTEIVRNPRTWIRESLDRTGRDLLALLAELPETVPAAPAAPADPDRGVGSGEGDKERSPFDDDPPPPVAATDEAIALAEEAGLDLTAVKGSGAGGRVTIADVRSALRARDGA